jgi:hypothetical protein
MGQLEIFPYNYNTLCDTYRCSGVARVSIGIKGEPANVYYNICKECLADLAREIPIDLIMLREDVQERIENAISEAPLKQIVESREDIQELLGERVTKEITIDYNDYGVRALVEIARERGLSGYSGLSKKELVKLLEETEKK